jgi:hypothetical protein
MNYYKSLAAILGIAVFAFLAPVANAHTTGESYVFLNVEDAQLRVRVEFHENDVESQFGIAPGDTAPDTQALAPVLDYVAQRFDVWAHEQPLILTLAATNILELPQGRFLQLDYTAPWPAGLPTELRIRQGFFMDSNPRHRSLLLIQQNAVAGEYHGEEYTALVFSSGNEVQELNLADPPGLLRLRQFLWQGAYHILIGYDHILFLLTLLLGAVVVRRDGKWVPEESFRQSLLNVAGIVTVFTLAHSVSLSLAALGIVNLPSQPIEIIIAFSIIVMAINNLRPFIPGKWVVIFLFGLFHGLGFASVMGHLAFRMVNLVKVMISFNIGVELGQLAIVLAVFPVLFLLRKKSWFVPVVIHGGSVVIALVAGYWLVERALG